MLQFSSPNKYACFIFILTMSTILCALRSVICPPLALLLLLELKLQAISDRHLHTLGRNRESVNPLLNRAMPALSATFPSHTTLPGIWTLHRRVFRDQSSIPIASMPHNPGYKPHAASDFGLHRSRTRSQSSLDMSSRVTL